MKMIVNHLISHHLNKIHKFTRLNKVEAIKVVRLFHKQRLLNCPWQRTLALASPKLTSKCPAAVQIARLCGSWSSVRQFSATPGRLFGREKHDAGEGDRGREAGGDQEDEESDQEKMKRLLRLTGSATIAAFVIWTAVAVFYTESANTDDLLVSWNEFLHQMLLKGEVEEVRVNPESEVAMIRLYPGAVVRGEKSARSIRFLKIPEPFKFEEKLRAAEYELGIEPNNYVPVSYYHPGNWYKMAVLLLAGILVSAQLLLLRKQIPKVNIGDMFSQMRKAQVTRMDGQQGNSDIKFKDVAGLKEAKVEIMEFVDYLTNPKKYKDIGAKIPRGALLLGPPGCGKTLLARAVSNEANVPFLAMAGSEFIEMIGGLGASRVRDLFKQAKEQSPSIIYIDEIDAIGKKRGGSGSDNSEEDHTLNQLLVEMDGIGTQQDVIMLAATNRADLLDKALLRPGRFDRHISIDLPTLIERRETFEVYLKKLKLEKEPSSYAQWLAQLTPGMSGADINNVCNEAAIHAATIQKEFVDKSDLEYAMERIVAGSAKKSKMLSSEEQRVVAYHECGHALVGWLLPTTDALLRISIVPRTNNALGFSQYNPVDQKLYSKEQLFERMCMALGGRVAEAVVFNRITTAAEDDLTRVTKLAYDQIRSFGMNEKVGCVAYSVRDSDEFSVKPYSKSLSAVIDEESRRLVAQAYRRSERLITENRNFLNKMAAALLESETLTYDEVEALIGAPPHGPKGKMASQVWETDADV